MAATLKLLTRPGCHLCEEAALLLKRLGVGFATIDIETDAGLKRSYGELIPVLLYEDEEIARAPLSESRVRAALARLDRITGKE